MKIVHVSQLGTKYTVAYRRHGEGNLWGDSALDELKVAIERAQSLKRYPYVAVFDSSDWNYGHPTAAPLWESQQCAG